MRHGKRFNHLSRKAPHRKSMLSNMASSLIIHKKIETTVAKAKALRTYVEPLITKSKSDTTHSRRQVFSLLQNKNSVNELFNNPKHSYTKALLSAVPKVKTKNSNKIIIKGDIPSPINPPSGCVFRTRCPNPTHDCKEGNIPMGLIEVSSDHWVDQCCVNCN